MHAHTYANTHRLKFASAHSAAFVCFCLRRSPPTSRWLVCYRLYAHEAALILFSISARADWKGGGGGVLRWRWWRRLIAMDAAPRGWRRLCPFPAVNEVEAPLQPCDRRKSPGTHRCRSRLEMGTITRKGNKMKSSIGRRLKWMEALTR